MSDGQDAQLPALEPAEDQEQEQMAPLDRLDDAGAIQFLSTGTSFLDLVHDLLPRLRLDAVKFAEVLEQLGEFEDPLVLILESGNISDEVRDQVETLRYIMTQEAIYLGRELQEMRGEGGENVDPNAPQLQEGKALSPDASIQARLTTVIELVGTITEQAGDLPEGDEEAKIMLLLRINRILEDLSEMAATPDLTGPMRDNLDSIMRIAVTQKTWVQSMGGDGADPAAVQRMGGAVSAPQETPPVLALAQEVEACVAPVFSLWQLAQDDPEQMETWTTTALSGEQRQRLLDPELYRGLTALQDKQLALVSSGTLSEVELDLMENVAGMIRGAKELVVLMAGSSEEGSAPAAAAPAPAATTAALAVEEADTAQLEGELQQMQSMLESLETLEAAHALQPPPAPSAEDMESIKAQLRLFD